MSPDDIVLCKQNSVTWSAETVWETWKYCTCGGQSRAGWGLKWSPSYCVCSHQVLLACDFHHFIHILISIVLFFQSQTFPHRLTNAVSQLLSHILLLKEAEEVMPSASAKIIIEGLFQHKSWLCRLLYLFFKFFCKDKCRWGLLAEMGRTTGRVRAKHCYYGNLGTPCWHVCWSLQSL